MVLFNYDFNIGYAKMFSRAARKAVRLNRKNQGGSYVKILKQGEKAARTGATNPYTGEDAEIWQEGYDDAMVDD